MTLNLVKLGNSQYSVIQDGEVLKYRKMGQNTVYEVMIGSDGVICSCPGFRYRGSCKHALDAEQRTEVDETEDRRFERSELLEVVNGIVGMLCSVENYWSVAGSWRRGKDSIGDLDFITTLSRSALIELCGEGIEPEVNGEKVIRYGHEVDGRDVQIDFSLTDKEHYGACLLYLTGSKDFNIGMRKEAKKRGWKLSRNGLVVRDSGEMIAAVTEGHIFRALGMDFVLPEDRETWKYTSTEGSIG